MHIEMIGDASQEFANVIYDRRYNNPRVRAAGGFPPRVESQEVADVVGKDRAAILRSIEKLVFVGDSLLASPCFLAAHHIVASLAQGGCQIRVNHLIGVQSDS